MASRIQLFEIYSILFLLVSFIYFLLGVYVSILNSKMSLNRVFFTTCMSLGLWAFSYSIANSAPTYDVAFFWHRVSVMGWGIMYSVLLHYFLVLTNRKRILKKANTYVLIYCPAIVNIVVFGIYTPSAAAEYNLIRTAAGWVNISGNGIFDWYFYIYYLAFSIVSLLSLWTWKRAKFDSKINQIVKAISISFAISILMGTITDVLFRLFGQSLKPQLGVIFAVVPIATTFYMVKKQELMVKQKREKIVESNQILSEKLRLLYYKFLSVTYFVASILILVEIIFYEGNILSVLFSSTTIFFFGLLVFYIPYSFFSVNVQDRLMSLIVAVSVPIVLLRYLSHASNNIIWVTPFLLMIFASIFNRRLMLILIIISAVLSQIWIWIMHPVAIETITPVEHLSRILIILLAAVMIYFIRHLYQKRLSENEEQTRLQKLLSEISLELVSANIENFDAKLDLILQKSGDYFCVDRAYLVQISPMC